MKLEPLTRIHLFLNLLLAISEQKELETNESQHTAKQKQGKTQRIVLKIVMSRVAPGHDDKRLDTTVMDDEKVDE